MDENNNNSINTDTTKQMDGIKRPSVKEAHKKNGGEDTEHNNGGRMGRIREKIKKRREKKKQAAKQAPQEKKMTGAGFYMIVGLAAIKDIIDFAGLTGVGAILTTVLGFVIVYIIWFYFFYTGVKYFQGRKLAVFIISAIIEILPWVNMIPTFTFSLFIIRALENNPKLKKLASVAKGKKGK